MISRFGKEKKSLTSFLNSVQQLDNQKSELDLYLEECVASGGKDKNFCVLQCSFRSHFQRWKKSNRCQESFYECVYVAILLCGGDWVKELHGLKRMKSPDDEKFCELECDFSKLSLEGHVPTHALAAP
ncbi:hypothetical protein LIER_42116 [Lithospermum erythrorhizon]|uniref:Uncharacterized protein n=1 Tax=Lithospermum erythrorhizon TaxID=34254 RepID=A0AAV3RNU2_LITER